MVAALPQQSVLQSLHVGMVAEVSICRNLPNAQKKVTGSHQLSEAEPKCCFCDLYIWRCFTENETQNPGLGKPLLLPIHIWRSGENPTSSSPPSPRGSIRPKSKPLLLLKGCPGAAVPRANTGNGGLELPFSSALLAAKATYEVQNTRVSTRYQIYLTSVHQCVLESRSWLSGEP